MTRTELNDFWRVLSAKQMELAQATRKRDGILIERTADALDEVQFARERELTTRSLERDSKILGELRGALARSAEGSFGTCLECEEEISAKRLRAVPWAALCLKCQEHADQRAQRNSATEDRPLRYAA